jgi:hypothetical protein
MRKSEQCPGEICNTHIGSSALQGAKKMGVSALQGAKNMGVNALQGAKKMGVNALSRVLSRPQPSMDPETFTVKYLYVPIDPNDKKAAEAAKLVNDDFIEKKAAAESVKHDILSPKEFEYKQALDDYTEAYRLAKSAHSAQGIHREPVKVPIKIKTIKNKDGSLYFVKEEPEPQPQPQPQSVLTKVSNWVFPFMGGRTKRSKRSKRSNRKGLRRSRRGTRKHF